MAQRNQLVPAFVLLAACALLLSGCSGSRVNKANYDKIADGMSMADVQAILGPGQEKAASEMPGVGGKKLTSKSIMWQDGTKVINVIFVDDKVNIKSQAGL